MTEDQIRAAEFEDAVGMAREMIASDRLVTDHAIAEALEAGGMVDEDLRSRVIEKARAPEEGKPKPLPPTHTVTPRKSAPPTPIENFKLAFFKGDYLKQVQNYYGGREMEALRFTTAAVEYVRRVPKLLDCEPISLMTALVQSAQFRFMPSGVSGEAYIIPYGREAKFQMGYKGYVTLLYRGGKIVGISSNIVYQNDEFEYEEGLMPKLIHKPAPFGKPRGEAIGVYTVAEMKGGSKTFKVMDRNAVMAIRNLSKAKGSAESPWNSDKDPELWMWRKTCLIQHSKLLPQTQELQTALESDYEGEGMERPHFDAASPAVGRGLHEPNA